MTTTFETRIAEVLAAHVATVASITFGGTTARSGSARRCTCGTELEVFHDELGDDESNADRLLNERMAAHQAAMLAPLIAEVQAGAWEDAASDPMLRNGGPGVNVNKLRAKASRLREP